jgi:hypothetical protein
MAQVIVTTTVPVPSGYHLKTKFLENYTLTDESEIITQHTIRLSRFTNTQPTATV